MLIFSEVLYNFMINLLFADYFKKRELDA